MERYNREPVGRPLQIGAIAAPKHGKTTLLTQLLPRLCGTAAIIDPSRSITMPGTSWCATGRVRQAFREYLNNRSGFITTYQDVSRDTLAAICGDINARINRPIARNRAVLLVEEWGSIMRPGAIPDSLSEISKAYKKGRHTGVAIWAASQRWVDINPEVKSCLDLLFVGKQTRAEDSEAITSKLSLNGGTYQVRGRRGFVDKRFFSSLPRGVFMMVDYTERGDPMLVKLVSIDLQTGKLVEVGRVSPRR